jgi:cell division protein FtsB
MTTTNPLREELRREIARLEAERDRLYHQVARVNSGIALLQKLERKKARNKNSKKRPNV